MHFLILSHHRSGSNFLTDLLQHAPGIEVIDEPLSMHTDLFPALDLMRWGDADWVAPEGHVALAAQPGVAAFVRDLFAFLVTAEPMRARGFKETLLHEKLPWLARALPETRLIYLVRDPRAVIHSVLRHRARRMWAYSTTVPRYASLYPDAPFPIEVRTELQRCVASWQIRHHEANLHIGRFKACRVRLEDLVQTPELTLPEVMGLLEQEAEQRQYDYLARSQQETRGGAYSTYRRRDEILYAWRRGLSTEEQAFIESSLAAELSELGYA